MTSQWHERMVRLAQEHIRLEIAGDIEGTLATMECDCVYELQPVGRVFRGLDRARVAYEDLTAQFQPRSLGGTLRQEWVTANSYGQESLVQWREPDGTTRTASVSATFTFGTDLLAGERIYAGEEFFRAAYGRAFAAAETWSDGPGLAPGS